MPKLKPAVAYLRVSTQSQGNCGSGLELQLTRIRAFAEITGYAVVETFSDVQSGMGGDSVSKRRGLRSAIDFSIRRRCPIIVDGLDRFSRNTAKLEELVLSGRLNVISARSGDGKRHAVVIAEAKRAQAEGELISRTTKEALGRLKAKGVKLGNQTNLPEAQAKGAVANRIRAASRDEEIATVLRELPLDSLTKEQIAEQLNRRGLITARGKAWTATTVRRPLNRIKEQIAASDALDANTSNPDWGRF